MEKPMGVIEPSRLYTAEEARKRLGLGAWAWRRMRRAGLRVIYYGRQSYVFSDELLRFFEAQQHEGRDEGASHGD